MKQSGYDIQYYNVLSCVEAIALTLHMANDA